MGQLIKVSNRKFVYYKFTYPEAAGNNKNEK